MEEELVVGLDSSTQSSKAIAWNRKGDAVAEGRAPIELSNPEKGHLEQSVEDWWGSACIALKEVCSQIDPNRISGLAISNQRETIGFVDDEGAETHPAIVWLDDRALPMIEPTAKAIGADYLHRLTGKPPDVTPVIYRLAWLKQNAPHVLAEAHRFLDVHGFLTGRLTGNQVASWTSADPFGVFDIARKQWSEPILQHLGLSADKFAPCVKPADLVGNVTADAAEATGLAQGTLVFAAGGDGQCAGLGVNATRAGRIYLNLGTAVITGAWSATPDVGRNWRTMTSPTGEGYFFEGVMRAGMFFVDWFVENFANGKDDPSVFERLEAEARTVEVGCEGLSVCPYLSGCMDPHWDSGARANFVGLGAHHTRGHLYRAVLESLAFEIMRCIEAMKKSGVDAREILAVGGGANSDLLSQMIADATGLPLIKSNSLEASALGAGMSAAVGAGWFADFDNAAAAMSREGLRIEPDPGARSLWESLSPVQASAYRPSADRDKDGW